jgi:hypothetical protein
MARGADVRSPAERSWWQLCRFSQQCSGAVKNGCSWRGRERLGRCDGRWVDELGDVVTRPRVLNGAWQRELGGVLASSGSVARVVCTLQSVQRASS